MAITERIDAITRIEPSRLSITPPIPKSAKIELTSKCNHRCSFCAKSLKLRDQGDMDRELFERLVLEMRDCGVEELGVFFLGESFTCAWLPEAIEFAKHVAKFPYVFLTTNGSLATPERIEACIRAGLDSLKFSLNYANREQFVEIARVKPALFDAMIANVKMARPVRDRIEAETGQHCGLYGSYIEYDGRQAAAMATTVESLRSSLDEVLRPTAVLPGRSCRRRRA